MDPLKKRPDVYIPTENYKALIATLVALDHDPAHPEPLRDRIVLALGDLGGICPVGIRRDVEAA